MSETVVKKPDPSRVSQGRGPGYPSINLKEAIDRIGEIRAAGVARKELPRETIYSIWKLNPQSSGTRSVLAALNHFGLVEYVGRGDDLKVKLSALALQIVLDEVPDSPERAAAIKKAALTPKAHADLFRKWELPLPADSVLKTYLVKDMEYSEDAARSLLSEYKQTLSFAGLENPDSLAPANEGKPKENQPKEIEVGDLIQVEIAGAYQLPGGERVRAIQEHEGRRWVFLESSQTGVQMEQAVLLEKGAAAAPKEVPTPPVLPLMTPPKHQDRLGDGEREWMRGPLGRHVSYRLMVEGDLGPKEIGKLIKVLKAQQAVFLDDEEEESED